MSEEKKKPTTREILQAPIRIDEIEWRIAGVSNKDNPQKVKTQILAYIQNRAVMQRLDDAFGWDGWENNFREVTGGFICGIKVLTVQDGEPIWILKEDGAPRSEKIEPLKGGLSDSMKRTAVQFGIGRDLYNYPKTFVSGVHKWIPDWAKERLEGMVKTMNDDPGLVPPVVVLHPPRT